MNQLRLISLLGLVLALAGISVTSAVAAGKPTVVEAGNASFPQRSYILTLPKRASIATGQVSVTENGQDVAHLSVTPAGSAGKNGFGTVLVIDTSKSMTGRPIESAMQAARTFAGRRNHNQQLALITFNNSSNIVLPFTSDGAEISQALARTPKLSQGTHIYDAVADAVGLIDRAGLKAGTIVLLSDGADVGSKTKYKDAVKAMTDGHVRLFSVGLKSGAFDASTLSRLSGAGKGSFSVATSSASLSQIYDTLGFKLANEYLVSYASLAAPDRPVRVRVHVAGYGAAAVAGYRSPPVSVNVKGPSHRSVADVVIQSWVTMLVIAVLIAGILAYAVRLAIVRPGQSVQRRLAEFVSITREDERRRREEVRAALRRDANGWRQIAQWKAFSEDVALADISISPARLLLWTVVAAFFFALLGGILFGIIGVLLVVVPFFLVRAYVSRKLKRRRAAFGDQLADNLEVLASALRAGYSLVGALSVVVDDAAEPSRTEFQRVLADEQLGVPLEDALAVTVKRMDNRDLDQVAVVAVLQRDAGANSAEVLDQIVDNIRARQEIRRLVIVLTAQGRMARWIVSLLPVFLLLVISLLNGPYMKPMWHETIGHVFLALAAIMITVGSMLIGRIVDIKV